VLIEFSVENYKSFRERATLSMIAANLVSEDKKLDEDNLFEAAPGFRLLRSAAIYGANASGKSNLVSAFKFMQKFVMNSVNSTKPTNGIDVEPFVLNTQSTDRPSIFEVVFCINSRQYRYGFEVTKHEVLSEWLFVQLSTKETTLFAREGSDIRCGRTYKEGHGLENRTRPNALFLSVAAQFNGRVALSILGWFQMCCLVSGLSDNQFRPLTVELLLRQAEGTGIVDFVRALDTGVGSLGVKAPASEGFGYDFDPYGKVTSEHNVRDGNGHVVGRKTFDVTESESQGTQKLIGLAAPILTTLRLREVMFIDEFDARLHPIISRAIISMFNDPKINAGKGQLIAVTHDTNLLDKSLFRRDQIWFVEKDKYDQSHLTSLAEYRVKNDAAYEKNYLQGRYSAIPFIGDLSALPKVKDVVA